MGYLYDFNCRILLKKFTKQVYIIKNQEQFNLKMYLGAKGKLRDL